jgi:uncharacterized protein YecE (DUF72 family)
MIFVGTSGWNIPRVHKVRFATDGTGLERYASRLNAAEINSSFYRSHAANTYERWSTSVPRDFRFAVKMPRAITHERALLRGREPLTRFLDEIAGLGSALGPLLVQLPPSHAFDSRRVGRFLALLRGLFEGDVVCEPRHASWTSAAATKLLTESRVARVAADPPRAPGLQQPGGWPGILYFRWHGSPRPYFSAYSEEQLDELAVKVSRSAVHTWCIFDNTGSGAAAGNALDLRDFLSRR